MKTKITKIGSKITAKKVAQKAESSLSFVERNGKGILILTGLVFAGLIGYRVYKKVTKVIDAPPPEVNVANTGQNLDRKKATISEAIARNLASQLLNAMNRWGTDEKTIFGVFQQIGDNPDNFLMVYQAFGLKMYDGLMSYSSDWMLRYLQPLEPKDLIFWLKSELSESEQRKIAPVIRKAGFAF